MKKQNLLILSLILISFYAYSQAPRGFYLATGYSQTSLKSSDFLSESKPGFFVGSNFNFGYHESYNYQVEVLYKNNSIGAKYVDNSFSQVREADLKYSTVELGFYLNYYILKPDEGKFFFGPQAGIFASFGDNLSTDKEDQNGQNYLPYLINSDELDDFAKLNYGFGAGLTGGYNNFRFDIRYSMGLPNMLADFKTNSFNENNIYTGPTLSGKTNSLTFGVSYVLLTGKNNR